MNELIGNLISAGLALPFTTAAASLMKTMCEPVAKELGKIGGDTISVIRARYLDDVLNRASKKIEDRGITAGNVAPKLLLPILESASLEDDDWMKDRWADLIATAATGDEEVDPAFATMLAELTPIEAKDLVENVQRLHKPRAEDKLMDEGFVHLDNWLRLRIIEPRSQGFYYMLSDLGTRFLKACGAMQPDSSADETNRSEEADA